MKLVFADLVTEALRSRPDYPPRPVGVGLWVPGLMREPKYFGFGHPVGNNSTPEEAREAHVE